eukprot:jgi/Bigna1/146242/aug1.111_g20950
MWRNSGDYLRKSVRTLSDTTNSHMDIERASRDYSLKLRGSGYASMRSGNKVILSGQYPINIRQYLDTNPTAFLFPSMGRQLSRKALCMVHCFPKCHRFTIKTSLSLYQFSPT